MAKKGKPVPCYSNAGFAAGAPAPGFFSPHAPQGMYGPPLSLPVGPPPVPIVTSLPPQYIPSQECPVSPPRKLPGFTVCTGPATPKKKKCCASVKVKPIIVDETDSEDDSDDESVVTATSTATSCSTASTDSAASSTNSEATLVEGCKITVHDDKIKVKCTCKSKSKCTCKEKTAKDEKKNDKKKEDDTADIPGTKLPGGLREGVGYLYTGKPLSLHVVMAHSISLERLTDPDKPAKKFSFRTFTTMDNATVAELLTAMGGSDKASVTQVWEWGGTWKKGSKLKIDAEKADVRLRDLGWSGAGGKKKAPVWLYYVK